MTVLWVNRRREDANLANHAGKTHNHDFCDHTLLEQSHFFGRNLGAPLQSVLADQAEQFLTLASHGPQGRALGKDHAIVTSQHSRILQTL